MNGKGSGPDFQDQIGTHWLLIGLGKWGGGGGGRGSKMIYRESL